MMIYKSICGRFPLIVSSMLITLILSACAHAPASVALDDDHRKAIKKIAILTIEQPKQIKVISASGAGVIASSIPGLGVLGAALVAGTTAAMGQAADGTLIGEKQTEYNELFAKNSYDFAAKLRNELKAQMESKGYEVIFIDDPKLAIPNAQGEFDFGKNDIPADAVLHVKYTVFGYMSAAFSTTFKPQISLTAKLIDAKNKTVLFSMPVRIPAPQKNGEEVVGFDGFESLKTEYRESYSVLLNYQALMAKLLAKQLAGEKDVAISIANQNDFLAKAQSKQALVDDNAEKWNGLMACDARHDNIARSAYKAKFVMEVKGSSVNVHRQLPQVAETLSGQIAENMLVLLGEGYLTKTPDKKWQFRISGDFQPDAPTYSGKGNMIANGHAIRACELTMTRAALAPNR
ncbi:hypothetical protein [Herminiimonas arsenitoxidans]|uniref:hypothetical protein n=1 Tax=Herminiimonas arsenitoxidans TaxID=1809410 RepID=UPI0012FFBDD0|nr:hypothetical protein [Herminiimonas arsenitoxidans]